MDGVLVSCYPIFRYSIITLHGYTVQLFIHVYNTIQLLMDLHILVAMLILDHHQSGSILHKNSSKDSTDGTPIKGEAGNQIWSTKTIPAPGGTRIHSGAWVRFP